MVYLSELTLDPRRHGVLGLLGDTYALHQELAKAFPHREQGGMGRTLFRVESGNGAARVLVQSTIPPDWDRLDAPARVKGPKEVHLRRDDGAPIFKAGQLLRFRLRANPTVKKDGKRRGLLTPREQCAWFERKGVLHGFELVPVPAGGGWFDPFEEEGAADAPCRMDVQAVKLDLLSGHKHIEGGDPVRIRHLGVDFDGVLRVTDPELFARSIECGIGSAKGFGFGLLSVARA